MKSDFGDANRPRISQKLVELRASGSGPRLMASISVEASSIAMPISNDRGGFDNVEFRYSGVMDEDGTEIWTPGGSAP